MKNYSNIKKIFFIFILGYQSVYAQENFFNPYVEYKRVHTDNLLLENGDDTISAIVDVTSVGVDWQYNEARWTSLLNFNAENINYTDFPLEDQSFNQMFFDSSFHDVNKTYVVGIRRTEDQVFSSFLDTISLSNINPVGNNRSNIDSTTAYFSYNNTLSKDLLLVLDTSYTDVNFESGLTTLALGETFDDSIYQDIAFTLSDAKQLRSSWYFTTNYREREFSNQVGTDSRNQSYEAGFFIPLTSAWDLGFRGGYISDEIERVNTEQNGSYYSVGGRYTASSKFIFEFTLGDERSEAAFEYGVADRSRLTARYVNTDLGINVGERLEVVWRIDGRKTSIQLTRIDQIDDFAGEFIVNNTVGNDPSLSSTPDTILSEFVLDRTDLLLRHVFNKMSVSLEWSVGERRLLNDELLDNFSNADQSFRRSEFNVNYNISNRQTFDLIMTLDKGKFTGDSQARVSSELAQLLLNWNYDINIGQINLEAVRWKQDAPNSGIDFFETRVELSFRAVY